jgi:hypothetical protein
MTMNGKTLRLAAAALLAAGTLGSGAARADVVTDWNAIMQATVTASGGTPATNPNHQTRWGAIVQLAVFEAVNAIVGGYEPYLGGIEAPAGASPEAAVVAAAHRTLVALRPDQTAALDALRTASLAAIPDGPAKDAGIAVGEAAADAMLLARVDDGWDDVVDYVPGTDPGDYQPLPGQTIQLPGWGLVTPFGIEDGSQFRLPPPPSLDSGKYAKAYNEVKLLGRVDSPFRPQDRTNVAKFFASASPVYVFNTAARQISAARGLTLAQNAHLFALLAMTMADASIAMWDTKFHYSFWRPQAAIRGGDLDGNDKTEVDASWLPLIPTPSHPSYASGHACVSGSAARVLGAAFGKDGFAVSLTHTAVPGVTLNYTAWDDMTNDIDDARIYGGIHFRFDQDMGSILGRNVASYILDNYLHPVEDDDGQ